METELKKLNQTLKAKVSTPLSADCRPELDKSEELDPRRANCFQGLIGVLQWIVELGWIDIMVAVSAIQTLGKPSGWSFGRGLPCLCLSEGT